MKAKILKAGAKAVKKGAKAVKKGAKTIAEKRSRMKKNKNFKKGMAEAAKESGFSKRDAKSIAKTANKEIKKAVKAASKSSKIKKWKNVDPNSPKEKAKDAAKSRKRNLEYLKTAKKGPTKKVKTKSGKEFAFRELKEGTETKHNKGGKVSQIKKPAGTRKKPAPIKGMKPIQSNKKGK